MRNNATCLNRTSIYLYILKVERRAPRGASFVSEGCGRARVSAVGASSWGMPLAKARSEVLGYAGIEGGEAIYIDNKGNKVLSVSSGKNGVSIASAGPFYDGYATVKLWGNNSWNADDGSEAYGLIDKTGALVKDPTAKSTQWATLVDLWGGINHAGGGMVAAQDSVSGLWGYLDAKSGEWKIQPLFSEAKPFADGMAYAKDFATDDWGIIDDSGAWTAVPRLDNFNSDDQSLVAAGGLVYGTAEAVGGAAPVTSEGWMNAQGLWVASWKL